MQTVYQKIVTLDFPHINQCPPTFRGIQKTLPGIAQLGKGIYQKTTAKLVFYFKSSCF